MILCFINTETPGRFSEAIGIIYIAGIIAKEENKVLTELERFHFIVSPFQKDLIDLEALKIPVAILEQLFDHPYPTSPKAIYEALSGIFSKYCDKYNKSDKMEFVGYNAKFDYDFMKAFWEKNNDKYFDSWFHYPYIDVMQFAIKELYDVRAIIPNFKLRTVCDLLGITAEGNYHNTMTDIEVTKILFEKTFWN
jgi:DNA polymerase III epsilon subunit-like protein